VPEIQRHAFDECDEDIAKLYLKTASDQLRKMGVAARSKSMANLQRLAHSLSGASAFLGLTQMAKLLCGLEQAAWRACASSRRSQGCSGGGGPKGATARRRDHSKEANQFIGLLKEEFGHVQRQCNLRFP